MDLERPHRFGYVAALDGLRAVAVAAVLAYHHSPERLPGGFLGVSLFFTLSGFLITTLLFEERARTGSVSLRAFWARRVRRILPVAWLGLAVALVTAVIVTPAASRSQAVGDVQAALLNVANWRMLFNDTPYAEATAATSPVLHFWSLAIEEQFYLVLPLVFLLARTRRRVGALAFGIIALSTLQQLRFDELERIYYGTDTRGAELAAGVLLAAIFPSVARVLTRRSWMGDAAAVIALAGTAVLFLTTHLEDRLLTQGGFTLLSLVWAVALVGAMTGRLVPAVLGSAPLAFVGRLSFAIYVLHFPIFLAVTSERTGLGRPALLAARVAVTLAAAAAVHVLIENPIRYRRFARLPLAWAAIPTAAVVLVVSTVTIDHLTPAATKSDIFRAAPRDVVPAAESAAGTSDRGNNRRVRLLVIGDSTAKVNGLALQAWGRASAQADVWVVSGPACAVHQGRRVLFRTGWDYSPACKDFAGLVLAEARAIDADAVVLFVGNTQAGLWTFVDESGNVTRKGIDDPTVASDYRAELASTLARLDTLDIPVLWADLPLPDWDPEVYSRIKRMPVPGEGPVSFNNEDRWRLVTAITAEEIAGAGFVVPWRYTESISEPDGTIDRSTRPDGLHLDPAAARRIAEERWVSLVREGYRDAVARGAVPARHNVWTASTA